MKSFFSFILVFICISTAIAQQKGVLKEGYYLPGVNYSQPSPSQTTSNSETKKSNSEIKQQYITESDTLKRKYDTCMTEYERIPTPTDPFDVKKSLKHKECQRYYKNYMELTSRIIQLEQAGF